MNTFSIINSICYDNLLIDKNEYKLKTDDPKTNFICDRFNREKKFSVFKTFILNSPFVGDELKIEYSNFFYKSQI